MAVTRSHIRILRLTATFIGASAAGLAIAIINLSFQAARTVVAPAKNPPSTTPADYGYPYEPVSFQSSDGLALSGWFIPGGRSAVVLAHGHGASKDGMLGHAGYLNKDGGYSVLLLDFRASGESEGEFSTLGFYEWQDLLGAVRYLKGRPDVDPDRIGLLGASMGAASAIMLGAEAHNYAAVVADSSFASAVSMVRRFEDWFKLPTWPFSVSVPWAIQRYVGLTPEQVAPLKRVAAISPTPLLLIHGARDSGIPAADAYALHEAAGQPKELWIIEGSAHAGGYGDLKDEYQSRVLAFFARHLGG